MGLAILICLVLATAAALLITDHVRKERRPERPDAPALDYVNSFISTLYMVLLALLVVMQWQSVDQISSDTLSESATLTALVQTAQRMPGPEGVAVRDSATDYAKGVLTQEWPPTHDGDDDAAAQALNAGEAAVTHPVGLSASLGTIEDQAIGEYQTLAETRSDRLAASSSQTSSVLIIALGVLSLVTIVTPLFLGLRADTFAFSGLVLTAALVCLSFWFVLDLNTLFHGLIHPDSAPLQQFLAAPGAN